MSLQPCIEDIFQKYSEHELLVLAAQGDQDAFEKLVRHYYSLLYSFIKQHIRDSELAYDILQHVFLQLYRFLPELTKKMATRARQPLKAWLFRVAENRCVEELRKKRPILFSELEEYVTEGDELVMLDLFVDTQPLPEEIMEQHALQDALYEAIDQLPPLFRAVVLLRYTEDLSFSEIGRRLNKPENTVKVYFYRARPLLRALLTQSSLLEAQPLKVIHTALGAIDDTAKT